jgi:hypothetical protein
MRFPITALLALCITAGFSSAAEIPVGAAKMDVTPKEPAVLAGYGSRKTEFESIETKLWARAMVFGEKQPTVIVALDNCGVPMSVTLRLAARLQKHGIARERLVIAATHTHNAPNLPGYAPLLWAGRTTPEMDQRSANYTTFAIEQMEAAVVAALKNRQPMRLEWAKGRASFGGNRRKLKNGRWVGFGFQRNGPVDHSVPVLAARGADGTVRAVWANYACHCTTLGSVNAINGDWAGYANAAIERGFTNAVSLITIGCGADVGPQPSGQLEYSKSHGEALADEVRRLLSGQNKPLNQVPTVATRQIKLPLETPAAREHWKEQSRKSGFNGQLAKAMLDKLDAEGRIPDEVDYPITSWTFGDDLAMVFLAGEVVVDYAVRLNRELDWTRLWYHAWANDMPSYIPSRRVLAEGGYEPGSSQMYYEKPGPYKPEIEDLLVNAVRDLLGPKFAARPNQEPAPYHRIPGAPENYDLADDWIPKIPSELSTKERSRIRKLVQSSLPGVEKITSGEPVEWRNFMGHNTSRYLLRQLQESRPVTWTCPEIAKTEGPIVLYFSGGLGWKSQPASGFELSVGEKAKVTFDVTINPGRWVSNDKSVELTYLPNWRNAQDSGGFFFLQLTDPPLDAEGRITFTVRSLGDGSKRWFAIDMEQAIGAPLKKLEAALTE